MGSRPPRQQPLPKRAHQPRLATSHAEPVSNGLSMETITPVIAFITFPVAAGAAFVGYLASANGRVIAVAAIITVVTAAGIWALLRSQERWRRQLHPTNELLAGVMVGVLGLIFTIGGIAAVAPVWIVIGLIVLGGAWLIARPSLRT